jgi:hypothetical protein
MSAYPSSAYVNGWTQGAQAAVVAERRPQADGLAA